MTARNHTHLSADEHRLLEAWLLTFEAAWDDGRLHRQVRDLPPEPTPLRETALVELIKIDLQRRWQRGKGPRLEAYLRAFPELGTPSSVALELIEAEYHARVASGGRPTMAQFVRRFPNQAMEVRSLLGGIQQPPSLPDMEAIAVEPIRPPAVPVVRRGRPWRLAALAVSTMGATMLLASIGLPLVSRQAAPATTAPLAVAATEKQPAKVDAGDWENPALAPVDEEHVAVRLEQESELSPVGDAQTSLVVRMAPSSHAFLRNLLTHKVRGEQVFDTPLRMKNVLDYLDLDATGSLPENVDGDFAADAIHLRLREIGCAR
jgi:hypothetical protein